MSELLDVYKQGWRRADAEMILGVVADDFVYDHPVDGRITKANFGAYLKELFADYEPLSGAPDEESFEAHSEEVMMETDGQVTAWNWWKTATAEGAALKKAGPGGVYLERLTYFKPSAE